MTAPNLPADPDGEERRTWVKARRLTELRALLETKPRTTRELRAYFGTNTRTVQRDLQALRAMNVGVEQAGPYTYRIRAARAPLNPVEALAAHAATRLLYHHAPAQNRHYLEALHKLARNLPAHVRDAALRSVGDLGQHELKGNDRTLELVARAWFEQRWLSFEYRTPGSDGLERREVAVYFVEVSRANLALYVLGFERLKRRAMRVFRLSRMHHAQVLADTYQPEADFDARAYLGDAWGVMGENALSVRLRFDAEVAPRVLEGDHRTLRVEERAPDGSLIVRVRGGVDRSGLPRELLPWILGWGSRVEVLSPPEVRAYWLAELRAALEKYDTI